MIRKLAALILCGIKTPEQKKACADIIEHHRLYREFVEMLKEAEQISKRNRQEVPLKTTYNLNSVLSEAAGVSDFINRELDGLFLSEKDFEFKKIDIRSETAENIKEIYNLQIDSHFDKILGCIKKITEEILGGKDSRKNLENIRKHVLENVANQVFITYAELEKNKSADSREAKRDLDKIKDRLTRIIVEHYSLEPMEIQIGKDFNSDEFEIVNRVEGGEYGQFGSNSIVSITTWGYYLAGTKKPYSLAKVQVKV